MDKTGNLMMNWRVRLGLGVFSGLVVIALVHPVCNFVFGCGCSAMWSGGASTCELMPGAVPAIQACPWCAAHPLVQLGVVCGVWGLSFGIGTRLTASGFGLWPGLTTILLLAVVFLFCAAWIMGALAGFPGPTDGDAANISAVCTGSSDGD